MRLPLLLLLLPLLLLLLPAVTKACGRRSAMLPPVDTIRRVRDGHGGGGESVTAELFSCD
jgi:hypothetical protein